MSVDEVRASAIKAATRGRAKVFAEGTVSAISGEGDPAWELKLREKIKTDTELGNNPRGKFSR